MLTTPSLLISTFRLVIGCVPLCSTRRQNTLCKQLIDSQTPPVGSATPRKTCSLCFECIHRPFEFDNLPGIDELPELIFYCRWIAIDGCNDFSRFHFAIGNYIRPTQSASRICSRSGTRRAFPPLSFFKTRFACLDEHPRTRSTSSLLVSAVRLSRSVSNCWRLSMTSASLSSPPATSRSSTQSSKERLRSVSDVRQPHPREQDHFLVGLVVELDSLKNLCE